MEHDCDKKKSDSVSLRIPFTAEEAREFRTFIEQKDKVAGRWVRGLILAGLSAEARGDHGIGGAA